jgi:L-ribulokinase
MAIVAGVDFGTLSVRVSIVDSERGLLATSLAEYPLHRKREGPEYAAQSHDDQRRRAWAGATREAVRKAGIGGGHQVRLAFRRWETFSTPLPLALEPMSRRRAKDW